jgi:reductive dehalogenase
MRYPRRWEGIVEIAATIVLALLAAFVLTSMAGFAIAFARERETKAALICAAFALVGSLPLFAVAFATPMEFKLAMLVIMAALIVAVAALFMWPTGEQEYRVDIPSRRFDERDIMFARARLKPGSKEYNAYYKMRPKNKKPDDKMRALPGLMSLEAQRANLWAFASAEASFSLTEALRDEVTGPAAKELRTLSVPEMSEYVKALARYYGARTVGITELQPYHVYSHVGRGSGKYGATIKLEHRYAIAFTVEMDYEMMGPAPEAATVMESARQYVEAAKIALQLCYFLRHLGHPARAHIDGNYQVIAPLVARDAGLGEIGRMGLLMTPELGPRVRLGVVTTDLEMIPDGRKDGRAVIDFCNICLKCAENCPSRSISFEERQEIDGAFRWRIDADSCFRYWNTVGTDCGRCVTVCPYSHLDNRAHNIVRWSVERSGFARRLMHRFDDIFYGRYPKPRPVPDWIPPFGESIEDPEADLQKESR